MSKTPHLILILLCVQVTTLYADDIPEADASTGASAKGGTKARYREIETFTTSKPNSEQYLTALRQTGWTNPTPSYKELGLSKDELLKLVGDKVIVFSRQPLTITVPWFGKLIEWENGIFSTTITEMPLSANDMRQLVLACNNQNQWKDYFPSISSTKLVKHIEVNSGSNSKPKSEFHSETDFLIFEKVHFEFSIIDINSRSYYKNTLEANGDITGHSLTADIGVSIGYVPLIPKSLLSPVQSANINRWEFIEISASKSLLVRTSWGEVIDNSKTQAYMKKQRKKNGTEPPKKKKPADGEYIERPILVNTGYGAFMSIFKTALNKQAMKLSDKQHHKNDQQSTPLTPDPNIPNPLATLPTATPQLVEHGPLYIMHPVQNKTLNTDKNVPMHYTTVVTAMEHEWKKVREHSARLENIKTMVGDLDASELVSGTSAIPNFETNRQTNNLLDQPIPPFAVKYSATFAKNVPVFSAFKLDTTLEFSWISEQQLNYQSIGGDIAHIAGAIHWQPLQDEQDLTLFAYTGAMNLGEKPRFPMSLASKVPGFDLGAGMAIAAGPLLKQQAWINWKYKNYPN